MAMRKVISNTTPILSLFKIDKLGILKELYDRVIIPFAVYEEIEQGKEKPYYQDLRKLDWIDIKSIKNEKSRLYFLDLDKGEAEVLILSGEENADLVIIDELLGRRYAKQMNINLTGTIGILLKAKSKGIIPSVKELLFELREKGSWINPKLIMKILKLAGE
ncbi:MAG: DUF3368 domain-containing protein [Candidatus Delongbacteria bacterium]|nr:MAG: DUF3368 domain-containing protein [Candidatus Delongbacteria bacterium]